MDGGSEIKPEAGKIVIDEKQPPLQIADREATSTWLLVGLGVAFAIVGLVDLGLLWLPLHFGDPAWEFGTLSRTFDSLPMTGLGFGLAMYGLVRHRRTRPLWVRAAAIFLAVVTVVLLALGLLYVTAVPAVVQAAPTESMDAFSAAVAKTVVEIIVYSALCATLATVLWRGVRRGAKRSHAGF